MKTITFALAMLISVSAFASSQECKKFEAFRLNQEAKLSLSRYSLGLINAAQLKAQQDAQRGQLQAAWDKCEAAK